MNTGHRGTRGHQRRAATRAKQWGWGTHLYRDLLHIEKSPEPLDLSLVSKRLRAEVLAAKSPSHKHC